MREKIKPSVTPLFAGTQSDGRCSVVLYEDSAPGPQDCPRLAASKLCAYLSLFLHWFAVEVSFLFSSAFLD